VTAFLTAWAEGTWQMILDSAPYFLLGLVLAGLIWVFLNEKNLSRLVGSNRNKAVWRAAIIGVPLPLCSCSVLPVATQLRQTGLSKGATASFLISTPESSVDSILLTYSLTDPLLTVARPVVAFLTAAAAGLTENAFDGESAPARLEPVTVGCGDNCARASDHNNNGSIPGRILGGLRHAFTTLIGDLAPYLFLGFFLAG
jgi:uncharacterized membrane protein YraQ (UPF0718 family)